MKCSFSFLSFFFCVHELTSVFFSSGVSHIPVSCVGARRGERPRRSVCFQTESWLPLSRCKAYCQAGSNDGMCLQHQRTLIALHYSVVSCINSFLSSISFCSGSLSIFPLKPVLDQSSSSLWGQLELAGVDPLRQRHSLTALTVPRRCVGLARRRVGRGGR